MVLMSAGCAGAPGGSDGLLADDWAPQPQAQPVLPKVGDCHRENFRDHVTAIPDDVITCDDQRHHAETIYVGQFTGAAAALSVPPELRRNDTSPNGKAYAEAFAECDREGTKYLGHPWYSLTIYLEVVTPTPSAWQAGARWFRCDLRWYDWITGTERELWSSLKEKWNPQACVQVGGKQWPIVDCGDAHNAEFVGGYAFGDRKGPKTDADWRPLWTNCFPLVADYLGISVSQAQQRYGVYAYSTYSSDYWPSGARVMRCFFYLGKTKMTGSAKGTGTRAPRYS
jgi:hypothetical protein